MFEMFGTLGMLGMLGTVGTLGTLGNQGIMRLRAIPGPGCGGRPVTVLVLQNGAGS